MILSNRLMTVFFEIHTTGRGSMSPHPELWFNQFGGVEQLL